MMTLTAFVSAVLALLIAPGPTNTLMGLAGARGGMTYVLRLLPAELLGYLTTILPLVWFGARVIEQWPTAASLLKIAAALWVMYLAARLWRRQTGPDAATPVTARKIYLTTMLNPKALVFGLVLLPAPTDPQFELRLGLFCLMVSTVALLWGVAGAMTRVDGQAGKSVFVVQRIASVWLAFISVTLVAKVIWA